MVIKFDYEKDYIVAKKISEYFKKRRAEEEILSYKVPHIIT